MKGKYDHVEDKDHPTINMFTNLHPSHNHQPSLPHHYQHSLPHHHQHDHHLQLTRECQTSEEADSLGSPTQKESLQITTTTTTYDGASIEVVRRPRGRPPGSKNKPKPPIIITRDAEPSMSPYVLELPSGVDIISSITTYCKKRNMGLSILTGSGTVVNVTLRQPSTTPGPPVTFHGRFDILSLSATILPKPMISVMQSSNPNGFTISLAGPQGQVVGGSVVGSLLTAGTVYVIAASFNSPTYHRLNVEEDVGNSSVSGGGNDSAHHHSPPKGVSGGGGDSGGVGIYGRHHLVSDVIWAPTARQPPTPPGY